jgi:hypothetical protein
MYFRSNRSNNVWTSWHKLWHDGNDGSGSGLDADLLDGQHASAFLTAETDTLDSVVARGSYTSRSVNLNSGSNEYNGHFYWNPYDANGNHYPHFRDGSNGNGVDVNWRLYQGASNIVHYWRYGDTTFANSLRSDVDLRAPIFYDSNNTGYYVDAASTSNFNLARAVDFQSTSSQASPRYDTAFYVLQAQHWYGDSGSQTMYVGESGNDVLIRGQVAIGGTAIQAGYGLTMTGHIDLNNYEINYVNQLHFQDNVRFYDDGNDSYLNFKSGDTGYGAIKIIDGNSNIRGYIGYWDTNGFGHLKGGSWWLNSDASHKHLVIGGSKANNAYNSQDGIRLMLGGGDTDAQGNYYIGTNFENYGGTYTKLDLRWHTGIRMGAQPNYGGIRFYDTEDLGTEIFAIGKSGNYVQAANSLRAPIFYDSNNTGYYLDPAGTNRLNHIAGDTASIGRIGITNTSSSTKHGVSLYGGYSGGEPTYGMMFSGTAYNGTHGSVTSDWATYFTMSNTSNRGWIFRRAGVGNYASISAAGHAAFNGDVTAYYSDMRLKTKVGDIEDPIEKVKSLSGFFYEPNEIAESYGYEKERKVGVSAQEVQAVLPEAVKDAPIGDGYLTVQYEKLVPLLIEAIKEQQKQIDELKNLIK